METLKHMLSHHLFVFLMYFFYLNHFLCHFAYNLCFQELLSIFISVFLFCMTVLDEFCEAFVIKVWESQKAARYRSTFSCGYVELGRSLTTSH